MRANGWKINQNRFDRGDLGIHTWDDEMDGLQKYCARNLPLSKTIDV